MRLRPVGSRPSSLEPDDDMALPAGGNGTVSNVNSLDEASQRASLTRQSNYCEHSVRGSNLGTVY